MLTQTASRVVVAPNVPLTSQLAIHNLGPHNAANLALAAQLPNGAAFASAVLLGRINDDLATPYYSVQEAIDAARPGDTVKVAGVCTTAFTYLAPTRMYTRIGFVRQIADIRKSLTLQGGYTGADWVTADPAANPTTLVAAGSIESRSRGGEQHTTPQGVLQLAPRRMGWGQSAGQGRYGMVTRHMPAPAITAATR